MGDCSVIAYIHCLQKESILFDSIISKCEPNEGYFEVNFYFNENGKTTRKKVYVDDYIPYKKIPYNFENLAKAYITLSKFTLGINLQAYLNNTFQKIIETSNKPLFSHYKNPKFNTYMVGTYLLIEKAYAKVKGCYMNIEGTDIAFTLTGLEPKMKLLTNILLDYTKKMGKDKYYEKYKIIEDEFNKKYASLKEEKIAQDILLEKKKLREEYAQKINSLKEEIINDDILDSNNKEKIFDELNEDLENNLVTIGSELNITPLKYFGIWRNHRYDFLKCKKFNQNFYFYLWNPHGVNEVYDKKFKEKNPDDKDELKDGELILNFKGIFLPFQKIIYQNRKELLEINKNYKQKNDVIDLLEKGSSPLPPILINYFSNNIGFWLPFLWLRINKNKDKNNESTLSDLIDELHNKETMNFEQILWFQYFWKSMKPEIVEESEKTMKKK